MYVVAHRPVAHRPLSGGRCNEETCQLDIYLVKSHRDIYYEIIIIYPNVADNYCTRQVFKYEPLFLKYNNIETIMYMAYIQFHKIQGNSI